MSRTTALAEVPERPCEVDPAEDQERESDHQRGDVEPELESSYEQRHGDEEHCRQPAPNGRKQIGGPVIEAHASTVSAMGNALIAIAGLVVEWGVDA